MKSHEYLKESYKQTFSRKEIILLINAYTLMVSDNPECPYARKLDALMEALEEIVTVY